MTTILLVDDEPFRGYLLKSVLTRRYPNVDRVSSAGEALCLVEQPQFCAQLGLVVCSLQMPGGSVSAPEFVAEMQERLPYLPVLVLGNQDETAADYPSGWVWFLPHPVSDEDLLAAADQLMVEYSWKSA